MPDPSVRKIRQRVASQRKETLGFLKTLVEINSHSANAPGINGVGEVAASRMPEILQHDVHVDEEGVNHHLFATPGDQIGHMLLIGHLDTVFPVDTDFRLFEEHGEKSHGPGVIDMKGGVVVLVEALRVLDDLGFLERVPVKCLLNGDEEVGSPRSQVLLKTLSENSAGAALFEAGGLDNQVVVARRGVVRYKLTVTGQARHAGVKEGPKASAILELARLVVDLEKLNDPGLGISLNVGTISGGTANNIVPDLAQATFEFRFRRPEEERTVVDRIEALARGVTTPGCGASLEMHHRRPCMVQVPGTEKLLQALEDSAALLGQQVPTEHRGGASDGNFLSEWGVPVIDGLGPVGDFDHSDREYVITESIFQRIELTALFLANLAGIE